MKKVYMYIMVNQVTYCISLMFFSQVKVGDILDLVLSHNQENNTVTLMRVIPRRVFGELSSTEKYRVSIRRWKYLTLPKDEAFKP